MAAQAALDQASAAFLAKKYEDAYDLWTANVDNVDEASQVGLHINRGKALTCVSRFSEALACYQQALSLSPGNENAFRARTACYLRSEDYTAALASADEAIEAHPSSGSLLSDKAFCFLKMGKAQEAVSAYEGARDLGDTSQDTTRNYGSALSKRAGELQGEGENSAAEALFDAAIKIEATESRLFNRAQLCAMAASKAGETSSKDKHTKKALDDFRSVVRLNRAHPYAHAQLGTILCKCEEWDAAKVSLRTAIDLPQTTKDATLLYNLALALIKTAGDREEIRGFLLQALALEPGLEQAKTALAMVENQLALKSGGSILGSGGAIGGAGAATTTTTTPSPTPASIPPAPPAASTRFLPTPSSASTPTSTPTPLAAKSGAADPATVFTAGAPQDGFLGSTHALALLVKDPFPEGVDRTIREAYLSAQEFKATLGMDKTAFYAMPKWKRDAAKKAKALF